MQVAKLAVITKMWQLRWFIFIICLICTLQAVPAEANRVDDTEPPKVNRKNDAEECIWSTLDLFWVRNADYPSSAN